MSNCICCVGVNTTKKELQHISLHCIKKKRRKEKERKLTHSGILRAVVDCVYVVYAINTIMYYAQIFTHVSVTPA